MCIMFLKIHRFYVCMSFHHRKTSPIMFNQCSASYVENMMVDCYSQVIMLTIFRLFRNDRRFRKKQTIALQFMIAQHTEKFIRNLIQSNRNQIVFTISRLIWNQINIRLVPNQFENTILFRLYIRFRKDFSV